MTVVAPAMRPDRHRVSLKIQINSEVVPLAVLESMQLVAQPLSQFLIRGREWRGLFVSRSLIAQVDDACAQVDRPDQLNPLDRFP